MDAEFIDSDALGLTFVREVEELGSRRVVELCPDGKNIAVDYFSQGFGHILSNSMLQKFFFKGLELDWMLYGTESAICVEDWKAHTEYNGY
ncbi:hypothetical protein F3Y22_tig00110647pilonHSYRG00040 [Hibiscus syriacus]|uniref:Uncharacterized protein n=1 Tax=Hibiscus syriacus TaxID=106335 RepID=A0A6A3A0L4_HIBSY|nr:hypothetical protein F3Y22_tig00110647pilonHSYRG00040 [Hibiscus syriacus]